MNKALSERRSSGSSKHMYVPDLTNQMRFTSAGSHHSPSPSPQGGGGAAGAAASKGQLSRSHSLRSSNLMELRKKKKKKKKNYPHLLPTKENREQKQLLKQFFRAQDQKYQQPPTQTHLEIIDDNHSTSTSTSTRNNKNNNNSKGIATNKRSLENVRSGGRTLDMNGIAVNPTLTYATSGPTTTLSTLSTLSSLAMAQPEQELAPAQSSPSLQRTPNSASNHTNDTGNNQSNGDNDGNNSFFANIFSKTTTKQISSFNQILDICEPFFRDKYAPVFLELQQKYEEEHKQTKILRQRIEEFRHREQVYQQEIVDNQKQLQEYEKERSEYIKRNNKLEKRNKSLHKKITKLESIGPMFATSTSTSREASPNPSTHSLKFKQIQKQFENSTPSSNKTTPQSLKTPRKARKNKKYSQNNVSFEYSTQAQSQPHDGQDKYTMNTNTTNSNANTNPNTSEHSSGHYRQNSGSQSPPKSSKSITPPNAHHGVHNSSMMSRHSHSNSHSHKQQKQQKSYGYSASTAVASMTRATALGMAGSHVSSINHSTLHHRQQSSLSYNPTQIQSQHSIHSHFSDNSETQFSGTESERSRKRKRRTKAKKGKKTTRPRYGTGAVKSDASTHVRTQQSHTTQNNQYPARY